MTKEDLDKLSAQLDDNIKGIRTKITDLEHAKLDKNAIEQEIKPTIDTITKKLDESEAALKKQVDKIEVELKNVTMNFSAQPDKTEQKLYAKWLRVGGKHMLPEELKVLKISDDTTGGYLASPEVSPDLLKTLTEFSPIRSIATVRTLGRESLEVRTRTGSFTAEWVSEVGARNETTGLTFGIERLVPHELHARVDVSRHDLDDSDYNLEQIINGEFGEQFGSAEGTAFVTGNTTGKPEGLLTNANVGTANSGNATTITADGLIGMYFTPKSGYTRDCKWLMRRATMAAISKLKNNENDYLLRRLGDSPAWSILGADVVECPDVPAEANAAYPVLFGDFRRGYMIVDRAGITVLRNPYSSANTGTVIFDAYKRVGGKVVMAEAIYKMKVQA